VHLLQPQDFVPRCRQQRAASSRITRIIRTMCLLLVAVVVLLLVLLVVMAPRASHLTTAATTILAASWRRGAARHCRCRASRLGRAAEIGLHSCIREGRAGLHGR
jgi:membrane protein YdbS with pleckstrin-like domain